MSISGDSVDQDSTTDESVHDFVVVGSGAGGGPLAARLAEAGFTVALIEAGDEHRCDYYDVPIMQAYASEDAAMRWDFFVRHHDDDALQRQDPKFVPERDGVLYPRGSTLGGSTAISAMVTMYPHDSDWERLAHRLDDPSWGPAPMRRHFEDLERWAGFDAEPWPDQDAAQYREEAGRGTRGWLRTTRAEPSVGGRDGQFLAVIEAVEKTSRDLGLTADEVGLPRDPNDARFVATHAEGMTFVPVAVDAGRRNGSRERVQAAARSHPGLDVLTDTFATRVLIEDGRATGVEVVEQSRVFGASPQATTEVTVARRVVRARREVLVCGGAFSTPQLLMLSGIGPADHLTAHGIDVVVDSPGVGSHLQDRYEVSVVSQMASPYAIFDDADLDVPPPGARGDRHHREWREHGSGPYSTNGSLAGIVARSSVAEVDPDLFVFALPIDFRGYYPGYAAEAVAHADRLSVVVLKAHTGNDRGTVRLRSADPFDVPDIDFDYFSPDRDDLTAVTDGTRIARRIADNLGGRVATELWPGRHVDSGAELDEWAVNTSWGHHACGTVRAGGPSDDGAPLDAGLRVRGVDGLRVVDASVFPEIPGIFIASAVYMVSEKMAHQIIEEHR